MERIEKDLKNHMKDSNHVSYPDFDKMWDSIQQNEMKMTGVEPAARRPRRRNRAAIIVGLSVALMATPVYAAIQYDWSGILSFKSGIQSALDQGLGQTINQSITKDGATLTLHTAFTDENRTFLLYSLDPGTAQKGKDVRIDTIGLKDNKGKLIEGNYSHQWNEEQGVFQGFFETDWVMNGNKADVEFTVGNLIFVDDGKQTIQYNPNDSNTQEFQIKKDGIESVKLQSVEQTDGKVTLQSAVTFTNPEEQARRGIELKAFNEKKESIKETEAPIVGAPGEKNEFLTQQVFDSEQLRAKGTTFQIAYERTSATAEGPWNIKLDLSKKLMEDASFKENLNIPVDEITEGSKIDKMIVTPTQVRLIITHKEKYTHVPYKNYQLNVGGKQLEGYIMYGTGQLKQTELRFEMSGLEASELANKPVSLMASYRIDEHEGSKDPIRLTNISEKHQTINTSIGGYPITWEYYMKDNSLYVESSSTDQAFGGVNQTYYLKDNINEYGKPMMTGFQGDGNNKHIDVYKDFDKSELEIYTWRYTTEKPSDELTVQLKKEK